MARILALDYGQKRTGIAVTDEMQIIASGLTTIETTQLFDFFNQLLYKRRSRKSNYWRSQTNEWNTF